MDLRFLLLVSALFLSTFLVEARRRTGSRRRGNQATQNGYSWTRELGNSNIVNEEGFVQETGERNKVIIKSIDDRLSAAGFTKVGLLYDFSSTPPILSIAVHERHSRRPCYIVDTGLSKDELITILSERNNTVVALGLEVSLDGTSPALSRQAARAVYASNPSLRKSCRRGGLVRISTDSATSIENTEVLKVLLLDSVVNLRVRTAQSSRRPGGRPYIRI